MLSSAFLFANMAVDSVMVPKMARLLALVHIAIGVLLICFGIADCVVENNDSWTGSWYFGIWIGVWMCVTGGLGIPGSGRDNTRSRNVFAGIFLGFSITSAVFGGIIIICYLSSIGSYLYAEEMRNHHAKMAITAIILLLGVAELGIGIWAAVCCCHMAPWCACCVAAPPYRIATYPLVHALNNWRQLYTDNTTRGVGGGMVAVSRAQEAQPQMVLVPTSEEVGGHSAMVQASATTEMPATVYYPQEPMKPPPHV